MKIDNDSLSIIIPSTDIEGKDIQLFVPDVPEQRVEPVIPILEHIYSETIRKGYVPKVYIRDYSHYVSTAIKLEAGRWGEDNEEIEKIKGKIKEDFDNFISLCFSGASVITEEMKAIPYNEYSQKISDKNKKKCEGYFVFFYAAGRYIEQTEETRKKNGWGTLLTCTEYMNYIMTSSSKEKTSESTDA